MLMKYPVAEDAIPTILNLALLGPFESHVMGAAVALMLLTQELSSCVKKINF